MQEAKKIKNNNSDDIDSIRAVLHGDSDRFIDIVKRYKNMIFDLALRTTFDQDEAEDLAQDIFCKVYSKLNRFDLERKFHTWLYTIAVNVIRNYIKKNYRYSRLFNRKSNEKDIIDFVTVQDSSDKNIFEKELNKGVREVLSNINEKYRIALILHYFHKLDIKEMSKILRLPESTVKTHLRRARKSIVSYIEKNEKIATLFKDACILKGWVK